MPYIYTPSPTSTPTPIPYNSTSEETANWAGYAVLSNLTSPEPIVTNVSASWTVPTVNASITNTYSATWIGIGGTGIDNDTSLIQTGTEQQVLTNGTTQYYAWYELLPAEENPINMTVSAENNITASINLSNATSNLWNITITDTTTAASYNIVVTYNSTQLSAEWIVERPTVNSQLTTLANFVNATFTNCQATLTPTTASINGFPNYQYLMYDGLTPLTAVSNLSPDGTQFTVTYI